MSNTGTKGPETTYPEPTAGGTERKASTPARSLHGATGPRTQRGKQKSRSNAVKHGIFAVGLLSGRESRAEYNARVEDLGSQGGQYSTGKRAGTAFFDAVAIPRAKQSGGFPLQELAYGLRLYGFPAIERCWSIQLTTLLGVQTFPRNNARRRSWVRTVLKAGS